MTIEIKHTLLASIHSENTFENNKRTLTTAKKVGVTVQGCDLLCVVFVGNNLAFRNYLNCSSWNVSVEFLKNIFILNIFSVFVILLSYVY